MSDLKNVETLVLIKELLTRGTDNGVRLFREATITAKDGRTQLLGIMAAVEMKLDTPAEEKKKVLDTSGHHKVVTGTVYMNEEE